MTAKEQYKMFHWGKEPRRKTRRKVKLPKSGEAVFQLGLATSITYRTKKGRDKEQIDYVHDFGRPYPRLASTKTGQLLLIGGKYKITPEGLTG
jgi:hypothetical protein